MKAPTPRKPIITNDPKDPRLKAYGDSLKLYNRGVSEVRKKTYNSKGALPPVEKFNNRFSLKDFQEFNYENEGVSTTPFIKKSKNKPIGYYRIEGTAAAYKRPTTPVIYKKAEPVASVIETPKPVVSPKATVNTSKIPEQQVRMYPKGTIPRSTYDSVAKANPSLKMKLLEYDNQTPMLGTDDSDKMKKLLKGKIPKHKFGAFLGDNADALAGGAGLAADASGLLARKGKANVGLQTAQGALKGFQAGAALGPAGMIAGAAIGGISSLVGAKKQKEEMEEAMNQEALARKNAAIDSSNQTLTDYPVNGVEGVQYYKMGGRILKAPKFKTGGTMPNAEYEVEEGEVVQGDAQLEAGKHIATDMQVVKGDKHEEGGVGGIGGERVFSDTSKLPSFLKDVMKDNGITLSGNPTYAEVAEKLGTKKGNLQKKLASGYKPSMNTAKIAGQKLEQLLDTLFQIQEVTKPVTTEEKQSFRYGGVPGDDEPVSSVYKRVTGMDWKTARAQGLTDGTATRNLALRDSLLNREANMGKILPNAKTTSLTGLGSPDLFASTTKVSDTILPATGGNYVPKQTGLSKVGDFLNENQGEVANAGSYLANLASIKNLDTDVKVNYMSAPKFNYTDRSGLAKEENQRAFRTATQALGSTSRTVNASNTGALFAETLDNNSNISNTENSRRDNYVENFNNRTDRISAMNTQISNQASDQRRELRNSKNVFLPQQARTAFLQGVMGNAAMKSAKDLDITKAKLTALGGDENGVLLAKAKQNGFDNVNDWIDNLFKAKKKKLMTNGK